MAEGSPLGLYIHIPFCTKKCDYCDFVSFSTDAKTQQAYLEALFTEIDQLKVNFYGNVFDTLYIGGGTPSVMYEGFISALSRKIFSSFQFTPNVEFTIEVNPASFTKTKFMEYVQAGVNRLSIGVQCLNTHVLKKYGRNQSTRDVKRAFNIIKESQFANTSGDVMMGLSGQTNRMVLKTVKFLVKNRCKHISTYSLQIEPNTPLYAKVKLGQIHQVPDKRQVAIYNKVCAYLTKCGFKRYEVSNFARPGFESRHNKKYWDGTSYLGIGVAAHSFIDGYRYYNTEHLNTYITAMQQGQSAVERKEYVGEAERRTEVIMLSLRTTQGLNLASFQQMFNEDILKTHAQQINDLIARGMLEIVDGYLRITEKYFYVSNSIILELI